MTNTTPAPVDGWLDDRRCQHIMRQEKRSFRGARFTAEYSCCRRKRTHGRYCANHYRSHTNKGQ